MSSQIGHHRIKHLRIQRCGGRIIKINSLHILNIFTLVLVPAEVENELRKNKVSLPKKIKVLKLKSEFKDVVKILANEENLGLGEAEAIALSLQEKVGCFVTDDLEAREVAKRYHLEVHGTIGIVLRALKDKLINKKTALEAVEKLKSNSSLFITQDLIDNIVNSINEF